jgi:hypothetical protein
MLDQNQNPPVTAAFDLRGDNSGAYIVGEAGRQAVDYFYQ